MPDRHQHQQEVNDFLRKNLSLHDWKFSHPHGSGRESYIAHGFKRKFFVKVGAQVERYLAMANIGFMPPVFAHGQLASNATCSPDIISEFSALSSINKTYSLIGSNYAISSTPAKPAQW